MFKRIVILVLALAFGSGAALRAQEHPEHPAKPASPTVEIDKAEKSETLSHHLGRLAKSDEYGFETVYMPDGIRLYSYLPDNKPIPASEFQGRAVLMQADGKRDSIRFKYIEGDLVGEEGKQHRTHDYLFAPVDLSKAAPGSFETTFDVFETAEEEPLIVFTEKYTGLTEAPFVCPMCPDGWGATAKSSCGVCGMYTSAKRPEVATRMPEKSSEKGGDSHNH